MSSTWVVGFPEEVAVKQAAPFRGGPGCGTEEGAAHVMGRGGLCPGFLGV